MARRFGGRYSPDGAQDKRPRSVTRDGAGQRPVNQAPVTRVNPVGARVNILFIVPFFWAVTAFFRDSAGLAIELGIFALLLLSAWLTREGVVAQDAYEQRRIARRPAIPRKIFGAAIMGAALAIAGFTGDGGVVSAVIFGALGAGLHLASFGPDPLTNKGMEGIDEFQSDRVAKAVDGAEDLLTAMSDAIKRAKDRQVERRLGDFQTRARAVARRRKRPRAIERRAPVSGRLSARGPRCDGAVRRSLCPDP